MKIGELWGDSNYLVEIVDITEYEVFYCGLDEFGNKQSNHKILKTQFVDHFHLKEPWELVPPIEIPKNRLASVN